MWRVRHNKVTVTVAVIEELLQALWVFGVGRESGANNKIRGWNG